MTDLYLGLGSNLGDRERLLYRAVEILVERIGGLKSRITQAAERELGRRSKSVGGMYVDRPIDIDLLLYGDAVVEEDFDVPGTEGRKVHLSLPHPLMHERCFVMEPLAEVAPDVVHPILKKTFRELLASLADR